MMRGKDINWNPFRCCLTPSYSYQPITRGPGGAGYGRFDILCVSWCPHPIFMTHLYISNLFVNTAVPVDTTSLCRPSSTTNIGIRPIWNGPPLSMGLSAWYVHQYSHRSIHTYTRVTGSK